LPWVKGLGPGSEIWIWILTGVQNLALGERSGAWIRDLDLDSEGSEIWIWILTGVRRTSVTGVQNFALGERSGAWIRDLDLDSEGHSKS
jgi:hypothetical protein